MATVIDEKQDRAVGALLGLAVGDAIGTTLEFSKRDNGPPLTDMMGGGPFGLRPGEWTDDTAMALCLAESLLVCAGLNEHDLMQRFCRWWHGGENSCTGSCFDIGTTTSEALRHFERTGIPIAGRTEWDRAGNGSLMRLAPVAIYWHRDRAWAEAEARAQSATTHGAAAAVESCAFFSHILLDAIEGCTKDQVLGPRRWPAHEAVDTIARGLWRGKSRAQIRSSGYVIDTLEAALWSVASASSFRAAVLTAANLGDDADTVAAVTGQLAGALWGASAIPAEWVSRLSWSERIASVARNLHGTPCQ
jgi:ADP-ribosyl-[dinitrogen reductase] hydrolase